MGAHLKISKEEAKAFSDATGYHVNHFMDTILSLMTKKYEFDVIKWDDWMDAENEKYNADTATYDGKPEQSCHMVTETIFGKDIANIVKKLMA